eukprot:8287499-Alexandrium_andersonii.AAC.1
MGCPPLKVRNSQILQRPHSSHSFDEIRMTPRARIWSSGMGRNFGCLYRRAGFVLQQRKFIVLQQRKQHLALEAI